MNVVIFGATGMIGQGVLRECLLDPIITNIVTVGRTATGQQSAKLSELVIDDMENYTGVADHLADFDACFFCLGVSSAGMKEKEYARVTYGITLAAATALSHINPQMNFIYVSGAGTDSSEKSRRMWSRVKGRTENALLRLPFNSYMFRPGIIQPLNGIRSKTAFYQLIYSTAKPLLTFLRRAFPASILTTELLGRAMIVVGRYGAAKSVLESRDIYRLIAS